MIIQGIAGTRKSFLINQIKNELNKNGNQHKNQLLMVAPTSIATFNIHVSTIHMVLKIPIKQMQPLQGQALTTFQEDLKEIKYILIDELSFIGPKLLLKIDNRLLQAFPQNQQICFGGISVILVADLTQLPHVMDKPLYTSHSIAKTLWEQFKTIITLDEVFRQGDDK